MYFANLFDVGFVHTETTLCASERTVCFQIAHPFHDAEVWVLTKNVEFFLNFSIGPRVGNFPLDSLPGSRKIKGKSMVSGLAGLSKKSKTSPAIGNPRKNQ